MKRIAYRYLLSILPSVAFFVNSFYKLNNAFATISRVIYQPNFPNSDLLYPPINFANVQYSQSFTNTSNISSFICPFVLVIGIAIIHLHNNLRFCLRLNLRLNYIVVSDSRQIYYFQAIKYKTFTSVPPTRFVYTKKSSAKNNRAFDIFFRNLGFLARLW